MNDNGVPFLFLTGIFLLAISIILFSLKKEKFSLTLLIGAAFFLFLHASLLYPFLNVWDERFHALVARNLMKHPLMPTLYDDPVVNMVYNDNWARYHIWLHKQPFFMWQIALSYKIFGVNEFALRLPGVILCCLMVMAGYRSGKILRNENTGFYTAFLIVTSLYLTKLVSGRIELDQNDVSFVSYISLSFWAWLEYIHTKKIKWIFLIGLFSGIAILCKWLVGLLIYLAWGLYSVMENKLQVKKYWDIISAFAVTVSVALPWQILTLKWYPEEAKAALKLNSSHFTEAVDGHEGPFLYHFELMAGIFGNLVPYIIIPAFIIFYFRTSNKKICIALFLSALAVYLFFSFAATKMPSFTIVVMPLFFIAIAFLMDFVWTSFEKLKLSKYVFIVVLCFALFSIAYQRTDFRSMYTSNTFSGIDDSYYRKALEHNKEVFQKLHLPKNAIIFNVRGKHYIEAMYYSGLPAYGFIPTEEQYMDIKQKERPIALFKPDDGILPEYIKNDTTIILLSDYIYSCE